MGPFGSTSGSRRQSSLSLGRKPWQNLGRTIAEMSEPSFLRVWFGNPRLEVRDGEGRLLRVEDQRATERTYLAGVGRALWTTMRIAALGTVLAALLALPLGLLAARNLHAPRPMSWAAKSMLDALRSVHTLVFGLFFVGIVGLGATAGILAVAAHSTGTLGKLLAEAIESLEMQPVDAVRATGATSAQVFTGAELIAAQALLRRMPVGEKVVEAILDLVRSCRPGEPEGTDLAGVLSWGPGPRAARTRAVMSGGT